MAKKNKRPLWWLIAVAGYVTATLTMAIMMLCVAFYFINECWILCFCFTGLGVLFLYKSYKVKQLFQQER